MRSYSLELSENEVTVLSIVKVRSYSLELIENEEL